MEGGEVKRWQPTRLNYSHEALIEQLLANPTASNAELGAVFGRSATWVTLVRNSDLFLEKLAQRHKEISDPVLTANLEERLSMVTNRSLEVLIDKLSVESKNVPDALVIAAANFGAKAKAIGGFGTRVIPEVVAPAADRIERLAERLERLNGVTSRPPQVVDVEAREV